MRETLVTDPVPGVYPRAAEISPNNNGPPAVTRPLVSTVTFAYVPAETPVLDRSTVKLPDVVIGEPPTVMAEEPVIPTEVTPPPVAEPLEAFVIRP